MTVRSDHKRRQPGERFLEFARVLFSERVIVHVLEPAVADFRDELNSDGTGIVRRLKIQCRWYWSLLLLIVVTPDDVPASSERLLLSPSRKPGGGWFTVAIAGALYASTWQLLGWFALASAAVGGVLAYALCRFHGRHPSVTVDRRSPDGARDPEINLSSIHVGGDIAGLMFAAGSIAIVLVGLPGIWWFFGAGVVSSLTLAWIRIAWLRHRLHDESQPIVGR
jgi:hypothetical protein